MIGRELTPLLLIPVVLGVTLLSVGEYHYARGMAALTPQESIEHLTRAGEVYPPSFTFRTAQARQLYELARRYDGLMVEAGESLAAALSFDPLSADLLSKLLAVQRGLGHCADAKVTAAILLRLAPRSEKARLLASSSCEG